MRGGLRIARAFLRKDLLQESSYKLNYLLGLAGVAFSLMFLTFLSDLVGPLAGSRLAPYGDSYFSFVVLGIGLHSFLNAALVQLSSRIREAQVHGTLEAILGTGARVPLIVVCLPLYSFLKTSLRVLAYLGLGVLVFSMKVHWGHSLQAALLLLLTVVAFGCLGIFMAGLTIAYKRTEPVSAMIGALSMFLGGIYYPLSVFPGWLERVAYLFPLTPALEGLRIALLRGGSWPEIWPHVLALLAFVIVFLPLGLLSFRRALRRAMRDGTLTQF